MLVIYQNVLFSSPVIKKRYFWSLVKVLLQQESELLMRRAHHCDQWGKHPHSVGRRDETPPCISFRGPLYCYCETSQIGTNTFSVASTLGYWARKAKVLDLDKTKNLNAIGPLPHTDLMASDPSMWSTDYWLFLPTQLPHVSRGAVPPFRCVPWVSSWHFPSWVLTFAARLPLGSWCVSLKSNLLALAIKMIKYR